MKYLLYSLMLFSLFYSYFSHSSSDKDSRCEESVSKPASSLSQEQTKLTPEYIKGLSPVELDDLIIRWSSDMDSRHMVISSMTKKQIQTPGTHYLSTFVFSTYNGWDIWTHEQKVWFLTSEKFKQSVIKQFALLEFLFLKEIEPEYFIFFTKKLIRSMSDFAISSLVQNEHLPTKIIRWIPPKQIRASTVFNSIHPNHLQHLTSRQIRGLRNTQRERLEKRKLQHSVSVDKARDEFDSLTPQEKTQLSPKHIENLSLDQKRNLAPNLNQTTLMKLSSETLNQILSVLNIEQRRSLLARQIKDLNSEQKEDIAKDLSADQIYSLFRISPSTLIDMLEHFPIQQFVSAFPLLLLLESEIGDLAKKIRQKMQEFPVNTLMPYYLPMMTPYLSNFQKSMIGEVLHTSIDELKELFTMFFKVELTVNKEGLITGVSNVGAFLNILRTMPLDHIFDRLSIEFKQSLTEEQIYMLSKKNQFLLIRDLTKDQIQSLHEMYFAVDPISPDPLLSLEEGDNSMEQMHDYLSPQQREWLTRAQQIAVIQNKEQRIIKLKTKNKE